MRKRDAAPALRPPIPSKIRPGPLPSIRMVVTEFPETSIGIAASRMRVDQKLAKTIAAAINASFFIVKAFTADRFHHTLRAETSWHGPGTSYGDRKSVV